jgi:hypothetical protein
MAVTVPKNDGDLTVYNLNKSTVTTPRIYFVNGMRVLPRDHAYTAAYLSLLIERPINGIYNKTAGVILGSIIDGIQCGLDYLQNATARASSNGLKQPKITEAQIPDFMRSVDQKYTVWNQATMVLFKELVRCQGLVLG